MRFLIAGMLAAAVSWAFNRAALRWMGAKVIVVLVPLIEELAKSGAAVLSGSPVVATHGVFGLIEGVYDAWESGLTGLEAGVAGFLGHLFYGYVTYLVLQKHAVFWAAAAAGYTVHMLWNITVMKFIVRKRRVTG